MAKVVATRDEMLLSTTGMFEQVKLAPVRVCQDDSNESQTDSQQDFLPVRIYSLQSHPKDQLELLLNDAV